MPYDELVCEALCYGWIDSLPRATLEWILQAKHPDTRAARVTETATLAQRNERANQWKRPAG